MQDVCKISLLEEVKGYLVDMKNSKTKLVVEKSSYIDVVVTTAKSEADIFNHYLFLCARRLSSLPGAVSISVQFYTPKKNLFVGLVIFPHTAVYR